MTLNDFEIKMREKVTLAHYAIMLAEDAKFIKWPWIVGCAWGLLYWQCWLDSPWIAALVTAVSLGAVLV